MSALQDVIAAGGSLGAVGAGVAWVYRVERDLIARLGQRVAQLEKENDEKDRLIDAWRDRFYDLRARCVEFRMPDPLDPPTNPGG